MPIPQLSGEQLQAARTAAAEARRLRAGLKQQVRDGDLTLMAAIEKAMGNEALGKIKVADLLRSLPRVGETRSKEILAALGIAPNRRVRGLGRHQLERLQEYFS
ncbi:MAG: 30S ribosomal protein S13 [Arachnia propionica]|nr:MAG: 30S ribosomal protein S13 [Arachnia propionica]